MWHAIYEVGECNQGSRQTDDRAVQCRDEDLGVRVESFGDVQVAGYETAELVAVGVFAFWDCAGGCYVCASIHCQHCLWPGLGVCVRGEESS